MSGQKWMNLTRNAVVCAMIVTLAACDRSAFGGHVYSIPWSDGALRDVGSKVQAGDVIQFLESDGTSSYSWTASSEFIAADRVFRTNDYAQALSLFRPLAEKGDARAQYRVGYILSYGNGVKRDDSAALGWMMKAANQGNAMAAYGVGFAYFRGIGTAQDFGQALHCRRIIVRAARDARQTLSYSSLLKIAWSVFRS